MSDDDLDTDDFVEGEDGELVDQLGPVDKTLDARRRVEDKLEELRLRRFTADYDFDFDRV